MTVDTRKMHMRGYVSSVLSFLQLFLETGEYTPNSHLCSFKKARQKDVSEVWKMDTKNFSLGLM